MPRTGRRPGASGTRDAILAAGRAAFAERGYDGATVRGIARAAGVDAALVHHYFGSKEALFAAAMELPIDPGKVLEHLLGPGLDGLGERLVRLFLGLWEAPAGRDPFLALIRGAVTHERSATMLREFITREVLGRVAAALDAPDPALRAALVATQLIGLGIVRHVVRIEPVASREIERLVAAVAPTVQRYLTGELEPLDEAPSA